MTDLHIYQVIIGTEILNGRRVDKHFPFLRDLLLQRGYELFASFIIKDDPKLMEDVFTCIKNDPKSVMFSFGGIGATPDDLTREVAAKVFTNGVMEENGEAKEMIQKQFGKDAYPYRIQMATLPKGAKLLPNIVNNVPGFYLQDRFFFTPGFPQMAHPMIEEVAKWLLPPKKRFRHTICVQASENDLLDIMKKLPPSIDFSSLPAFQDGRYMVVISLASFDKEEVEKWMDYFKREIRKREFTYKEDECR